MEGDFQEKWSNLGHGKLEQVMEKVIKSYGFCDKCNNITSFQLSTGEVWVQYNDGSQMVIQSSVTSIKYTDSEGTISR